MNEPTIWAGCYKGSWNGILTPDSFAHPAKVAPGLAYRIYQHLLEHGYIAPGDSVLDPFGGIGGFAYHALLRGLHFTGVELEPRFVEMAQRNIEKWQRDLAMLNGRLGTARIVQGDSRRLLEAVGGGIQAAMEGRSDYQVTAKTRPGQNVGYANQADSPGNLAALRADAAGFSTAVSSPPYADAVNGSGEGPGARHDPVYHKGDNAFKPSSANGYGKTPGNLGSMAGDGWDAAVSSPPFEDSDNRGAAAMPDGYFTRVNGKPFGEGAAIRATLGDAPGNIGNDQGETFWSASRQIVEQTYAALRPGGYAVFVTKDFVRRGQRVPFSDQWQELCAAVGFTPVERIYAMLVDDHGYQLDIFGGATARRKERKSFFRRLAEKNGSPRIDHEDVIVMRKPEATP